MQWPTRRCVSVARASCLKTSQRQARQFSRTAWLRDEREPAQNGQIDVQELLAEPTWSVSSLLPSKDISTETPEISPKQLHHLLRLSALPPPKDAEEEKRMLTTLSSQLHFVKEIQQVDTTGIEPLRSLRDETLAGEKEAELGMNAMNEALAQEEVRGKHYKRIRRRRDQVSNKQEEDWDVLGTASKKVGRFFVVEGGKEG